MDAATADWRTVARDRAIAQFRQAWERAPATGREALVEAALRDRIGHKWETGSRACVLALLARPALRPGELPKAGAYRLFGCEVTDDLPATWDGAGVTAAELLASVGVYLPDGRPEPLHKRLLHAFRVRSAAHAG
jgi:hypothetical protein